MRPPDFFIVGAPRCGTTAMYLMLRQHPDVFMPYRKEPTFFGADLPKAHSLTEESYLRLFAAARHERRIGEASVWYLYSETAAGEIDAFSPGARVIIMLRDPVEMIASLHGHLRFMMQEDISDLGAALAAEEARSAGRMIPPNTRWPRMLQYRWLARFAPHVERYLATFGRERVHVILNDDLRSDPHGTYAATLRFLDVDPAFRPRDVARNERKGPRSERLQRVVTSSRFRSLVTRMPGRIDHLVWRALMRSNMRAVPRQQLDPALVRRLRDELRPDIERLARSIDRDLAAWMAPVP